MAAPITNTAVLWIIYQGQGAGPCPLNPYPAEYASQPLGAPDPLGFGYRDCGSFVMFMNQYTGRQTRTKKVLGLPACWPAQAPDWVITAPVPGCAAIRPPAGVLPDGTTDDGHVLFVLAVLPDGYTLPGGRVAPDGSMLMASYNAPDLGEFTLSIWAPSGVFCGVPFDLTFMQFPAAYPGT